MLSSRMSRMLLCRRGPGLGHFTRWRIRTEYNVIAGGIMNRRTIAVQQLFQSSDLFFLRPNRLAETLEFFVVRFS